MCFGTLVIAGRLTQELRSVKQQAAGSAAQSPHQVEERALYSYDTVKRKSSRVPLLCWDARRAMLCPPVFNDGARRHY
jgi:hypothetical protein